MDQKDLFAFFQSIREEKTEDEIYEMFENYEISKLDIKRMYRYLDKYSLSNTIDEIDIDDEFSVSSTI
jgi:hypothetical protein